MIDPLPSPITCLSSEVVESEHTVVVTGVQGGQRFRHLYGRAQVRWAKELFNRLDMQMDEAAKISAAS